MSFRVKLLLSIAGVFLFFGVAVAVTLKVLESRRTSGAAAPGETALVPSSTLPAQPASPSSTPASDAVAPSVGSASGTATQPATPGGTQSSAVAPSASASPSVAGSIVAIDATASDSEIRDTLAPTGKMIAERFGTYSSQNGFANLSALRPFMTSSLAEWLDGYIAKESKKRTGTPTYTATTTVALRAKVAALDRAAGTSTVVVETSRTDTGAGPKKTYAQNFEVKFKRESDAWKIDNVRWIR